jgi:aspartate/methionine/tyrosine aminotransferase
MSSEPVPAPAIVGSADPEEGLVEAAAAALTPATRVLLLNSPHNPTGLVLSRASLEQLAALAIEHQGELHSNDSDFGRFPRLRWLNPLR